MFGFTPGRAQAQVYYYWRLPFLNCEFLERRKHLQEREHLIDDIPCVAGGARIGNRRVFVTYSFTD